MTKSEYVRKRIEPLVRILKPFMNPEDDEAVFKLKIELWAIRLLTDVQALGMQDLSDITDADFPYTEDL